jgi:hypothetical protein
MNLATAHTTRSSTHTAPHGAAEQREGEQTLWRALGTGAPNSATRSKRLMAVQEGGAFVRRMKREDKFKFLRAVLDLGDTDLVAASLPAVEIQAMRPAPTITEERGIWLGCFNSGSAEEQDHRSIVVDLLAKEGLSPKSIPLFHIISRGDAATLERALAVGANPNQVKDGETPLITVARAILQDQLCIQMSDLLIAAGAIPLVTDGAGRRPSDVANRRGTMEAHRYLKSIEDRMQLAFAAGIANPSAQSSASDLSKEDGAEERPSAPKRRM